MKSIDDLNSEETIRFMTKELDNLDKEVLQKKKENKNQGISELKKDISSTTKFLKNVVILIIAQVLVKVLGLVYRIVIVNIPGFGDEGNGYYATGYEIYALLLALSSVGIPSVISKLVSERVAIGDEKGANRIFKIASRIFIIIGAIFGILLFVFSDFIAVNVINVPDVSYTLKVLAPAIMFVAWSSVIRGYFSGLEDMKPTSISQTFEQFLNCVITILLVYAVRGKDPYIMAAAGNLATTISVFLAFLYIYIYYRRHRIKRAKNTFSKEDILRDKDIAKTILKLSIPVTFASFVSVLNTFIDTFTVSQGMQKALAGMYSEKVVLEQKAMEAKGLLSKINTIVGLPQAVNIAISTAIVPSIAGFMAKGEKDKVVRRIKMAMNVTMLIVFPSVVGLFVLSDPILKLMYPNAPDGGLVMKILCIPTILICFSHTVNGALHGLDDFKTPMIAVIVGAVIKTVLNLVLIPIPEVNLYGATISSVITQTVAFTITYIALKKKSGYSIGFKEIFNPAIASIIMGAITYLSYFMISKIISPNISVIIAIVIGILVYVPLLLLFKAVNADTLKIFPDNIITRGLKDSSKKQKIIERAKHIAEIRKDKDNNSIEKEERKDSNTNFDKSSGGEGKGKSKKKVRKYNNDKNPIEELREKKEEEKLSRNIYDDIAKRIEEKEARLNRNYDIYNNGREKNIGRKEKPSKGKRHGRH